MMLFGATTTTRLQIPQRGRSPANEVLSRRSRRGIDRDGERKSGGKRGDNALKESMND